MKKMEKSNYEQTTKRKIKNISKKRMYAIVHQKTLSIFATHFGKIITNHKVTKK